MSCAGHVHVLCLYWSSLILNLVLVWSALVVY